MDIGEEKRLYFRPAEYALMMELAGGGGYSVLCGGDESDQTALTEAFSTLFQRELIERTGDGFRISEAGAAFRRMRSAGIAVAVRGKQDAMCYLAEREIWAVELSGNMLFRWYRVQRIGYERVEQWLFESELLPRPLLRGADAAELHWLFQDALEKPRGELLTVFERYVNGGGVLGAYHVLRAQSGQLIICGGGESCWTEFYTKESLSRMLAECFGKEPNDHCKCESTGN